MAVKKLTLMGIVASDSSSFFSFLGSSVFTPKMVSAFIEEEVGSEDSLEVELDSPGGEFFAGVAIFNILENFSQHQPLTIKVMGLAGSAASVIMLAGNDRRLESGATVFIHEPISTLGAGNRHALRAEATDLDALTENAISIYLSKTSMTRDNLAQMLKDETYLTAEDASGFNFGRFMGPKRKDRKRSSLDSYINELEILKTRMELDQIKKNFQGGNSNGSKRTA